MGISNVILEYTDHTIVHLYAYLDPHMLFLTLSILSTTVPEDYDINPQTSRRGDRSHHPELRSASVEYVAPSEYMVSERTNDSG